MDNLFSTHPATENRIAALQELSREMGQGGFGGGVPRSGGSVPASGPWSRAGRSSGPRAGGPWGR
jgi:heat shock protein HtpX